MSETTDRESLLRRIRALQQRTVANGCTEAEALAAAEMSAALLDRYGFSQSDLELRAEPMTEDTFFAKGRQLKRLLPVMRAIGDYCDCVPYTITHNSRERDLVFFGRESDVALALYLTHLCSNAMHSAWHDYALTHPGAAQSTVAKNSFGIGMARRLNERLYAMKAARNAKVDETSGRTGKELVVVKNAVVTEAFAARNLKMRSARKRGMAFTNGDAFTAGHRAGDKVALTTGVAGKAQARIQG